VGSTKQESCCGVNQVNYSYPGYSDAANQDCSSEVGMWVATQDISGYKTEEQTEAESPDLSLADAFYDWV